MVPVLAEEEDLVLRASSVGRCVVAVIAVVIVGRWSLGEFAGGDCTSIIGSIVVLMVAIGRLIEWRRREDEEDEKKQEA